MAKAHDRILEIVFECDESDDDVEVSAINYYRTRARLDASEPLVLNITAGAAAANHEVEMGSAAIPPPTHIRLKSTFVA